MSQRPSTTWGLGEAYESYMGRWSRPVARAFLAWLGAPVGRRWLDVGCGTGALASAVLGGAEPAALVGVDPAEGFVAHCRAHVADARARFESGSATALPVEDAGFDFVVSGLVLNFVPDPTAGLHEMRRATRPGGTVAAYVWDYAEGMQLLRRFWDAAVALAPAAREQDEATRFPTCREGALAELFARAGLDEVAVRPIEVETRFRDFDDYWSPFLSGQAPAPGYVATLAPEARDALRERLRSTLPTLPDGSIRLIARAWAARGRA